MALDNAFSSVVEYLMTPSPSLFFFGFCIVLFFPLFLHFIIVSRTDVDLPAVLLAGPSQTGKTSFANLLEYGTVPREPFISYVDQSVELTASTDAKFKDSFKANLEDTSGHHTKFQLVDTPGQAKLRTSAFAKLSPPGKEGRVKAVVYFVDAAALGSDEEGAVLSQTAEYLYDLLLVLQKKAIKRGRDGAKGDLGIPLLIAANKMDLFTALPALSVKTSIEAELTRIRDSRSRGLLDSGVGADEIGSEERDDWLGEYGSKKFTFAQLAEFDVNVDVIGGSLANRLDPDVEKWWRWIAYRI